LFNKVKTRRKPLNAQCNDVIKRQSRFDDLFYTIISRLFMTITVKSNYILQKKWKVNISPQMILSFSLTSSQKLIETKSHIFVKYFHRLSFSSLQNKIWGRSNGEVKQTRETVDCSVKPISFNTHRTNPDTYLLRPKLGLMHAKTACRLFQCFVLFFHFFPSEIFQCLIAGIFCSFLLT